MLTIRVMEEKDWDAVWSIIGPVFRAGETYPFSPDMAEAEAYEVWAEAPAATFVATDADAVIAGTYYLKPNQPALGAHVCNCGYIVAPCARGHGVATAMCRHSQRYALAMGFRAMQFNLVVATNIGAVTLWQRLGFEIVGTLPQAFRHPRHGFVDAYVMYALLGSSAESPGG